jgi:hypothetical protein
MKLLDNLLRLSWLYEKIFWDMILDKLLWKEDERLVKNILKEVYWFEDVDYIFSDRLDYKKFENISRIIFKFYENNKDEDKKE